MFRLLSFLLVLTCVATRILPTAHAQDTAPSASLPPPPDPAKAERRALAEKLNALSDAEFTAYLRAHHEVLSQDMVVSVLKYGRELGAHGDIAGHAHLVQRAREMATISGSRLSQAYVQWHAAGMEAEFHHVDKGIAMINEAIAIATEEKAPAADLAGMLGARVVMFGYKGEYASAMADCDRTLRLATEAHNPDAAMAVLTTLINIYQRQGQTERSLPYLEQAQTLAANNDHMLIYVDGNYATTYHQLGQPAKTQEYLQRALATARRIGDENMAAQFLSSAGEYACESKDFAAARQYLDESLALANKLGNDLARVDTQLQLAQLEEAQGHFEPAAALARTALAGAQEAGELESTSFAQDILGRVLAASGQTAEATAAFQASVDIIEQIRAGTAGDEESSQAVLQRHIDPYQRLTALLVAGGHVEEAFAVAEDAKARVLRDILQNGRMDLPSALTDDESKRRAASEERIATLNHRLQEARRNPTAISNPAAASPVEKIQHELDAARIEAHNLDDTLLSAHPEVRKREVSSPKSTAAAAGPALVGVCDARTLFLEFSVSPGGTTLFVAGPGKLPLEAQALPIGEEALRGRVEAFRKALADRSLGWKEEAEALERLLLAPAVDRFAKAERVVIVPDGPLWDLPFQALRRTDGGDCLIDRLAVSYAPSAGFLGRVRHGQTAGPVGKHRQSGGMRLLAMGNPALGGDPQKTPAGALMGDAFLPLPMAEDEVRQLGEMYGKTQSRIFLGAQAREDTFKKEAPNFDILHLATHGVLNDSSPLYSSLLMAQTDLSPGEDGLLEAREIMKLSLHARLVILAACETARGKAGAGEGQLGLSWALMVAGCPASVVSQWKVDSRSNVDLMLELHRQLRAGKSSDEALRLAALAVRKMPGCENPFYWAPFVVVGDGR